MALVLLQLFLCALFLHRCIAPRLRKFQTHLLAKQLEAIDFVDGLLGTGDGVEDDEGLAAALQTLFGDNVDDGAVFAEDFTEGVDQGGDLDAFF